MACATKFAFGYLTPCSLLPNRSGFPCPNCKMKACKEMEGGIDRATCNIGWMGESALEFLPFKSNLGRTSMDRQICLKRKIIYRPASGAADGVACQSRQTETEERTRSPFDAGRAARPEAAVLPSRESNLLYCHRRRRYDWSRALSRMRRLHHVCIIESLGGSQWRDQRMSGRSMLMRNR